jgi:hypothetical protein
MSRDSLTSAIPFLQPHPKTIDRPIQGLRLVVDADTTRAELSAMVAFRPDVSCEPETNSLSLSVHHEQRPALQGNARGGLGLRFRHKQLAPAVRADLTLNEFASVGRLKVDASVAVLVAFRCSLIFGGRLADLLLRRGLRNHRSRCGCDRAERKRRTPEHRAA